MTVKTIASLRNAILLIFTSDPGKTMQKPTSDIELLSFWCVLKFEATHFYNYTQNYSCLKNIAIRALTL
jgi:hypothetical protein